MEGLLSAGLTPSGFYSRCILLEYNYLKVRSEFSRIVHFRVLSGFELARCKLFHELPTEREKYLVELIGNLFNVLKT